MPAVDVRTTAFLSLEDLVPDPAVARLLPEEVARRYCALPVAQDNGFITVVMADPGDEAARAAVTAILTSDNPQREGAASSVYVVQGDAAAITARLAELWPTRDPAQEVEVWLRDPIHGDKARAIEYAENVAALLHTPLAHFHPITSSLPEAVWSSPQALVILPCNDHPLRRGLLERKGSEGPAVMIACRPRWPLHKILVIVRGDEVDDVALLWAARLARPSSATLTALMVAPSTLAGPHETAEEGIASLLTTNNAMGRKMKRVAQHLATLELHGTLHLRQGAPEAMIREELETEEYDLAIAGIAVRGWEAQWRLRPLLDRLLQDAFCPLLIVKA